MADCSHAQIACRLATAGFAARVAAPIKSKLSREVLNYASLERLLNEKKKLVNSVIFNCAQVI